MRYSPSIAKSPSARDRAAMFVDYDNLFTHLYGRTGPRLHPAEVIDELLHEVRLYLQRELRTSALQASAYADFSEIHGRGQDIKRGLYLQGVEPRFVPASMQRNSAELQLTMDVVESAYTHLDIRYVVIVTGDRPYLPLIQHSHRIGRRPVLVMLRPPANERYNAGEDLVVNAMDILSEATVRELGQRGSETTPPEHKSTERPRPVEYLQITHPGALTALDVIEEHFGQYDEIYLTPLLRKLSEVIGDTEYDPKSLISELEDVGAIWLEKRKGFPYDYTVLIIDADHPNVAAVQQRDDSADRDLDAADYAREADYATSSYADPFPQSGTSDYQEESDYADDQDFQEDDYQASG